MSNENKVQSVPGEEGEGAVAGDFDVDDLLRNLTPTEFQLIIARLLYKGKLNLDDLVKEVKRLTPESISPEELVGKYVQLQSFNYHHMSIAAGEDCLAYLIERNDRCTWKIIAGLNGKGVSFENVRNPKHYLRHQGFRIKSHSSDGSQLFKDDASFMVRKAISGDRGRGYVSFESTNYPSYFLRHKNYEAWIHPRIPQGLYEDDASFKIVELEVNPETEAAIGKVVSIQSLNYPEFRLSVNSGHAFISQENDWPSKWTLRLGLNGKGVSFESVENPGKYLRHQGYRIKLHSDDGTQLFRDDASFEVRKSIAVRGMGYVSFESTNYASFFIRHKNYEAWIDPKINQTLYEEDASFKMVVLEGADKFLAQVVQITCFNYPDHLFGSLKGLGVVLDRSDAPASGASVSWTVVPGLNGKGISLTNGDNFYLRHQNYRLKLARFDGTQLFRDDASFELRPSLADQADFYSFESTNFPGYYLRHRNFETWLDVFNSADGDLFTQDASFKLSTVEQKNEEKAEEQLHDLVGFTFMFQSVNYSSLFWGVGSVEAFIADRSKKNWSSEWIVHRGLNGSGVSFESASKQGLFLRHQGYRLKLHADDGSQLFKDDASFRVRRALSQRAPSEGVSFESTNYPGYFIRHKNSELWIDPNITQDLYKADASFTPLKVF